MTIRWASALALLAGSLLLSTTAGAEACREVCSDAKQMCHRTSRAAVHACRTGCRDTIVEATHEARATCEAQGLEGRDCGRVVKRAIAGALQGCGEDCRTGHERANAVCQDERNECREICLDGIDPVCRGECAAAFETCRDDVKACSTDCREQKRAEKQACRDRVRDVCDPELFRECLKEARIDARMCVEACHEVGCHENVRSCLSDCPLVGDEAAQPLLF